jgi:hypothetical protein
MTALAAPLASSALPLPLSRCRSTPRRSAVVPVRPTQSRAPGVGTPGTHRGHSRGVAAAGLGDVDGAAAAGGAADVGVYAFTDGSNPLEGFFGGTVARTVHTQDIDLSLH